MCGISGFTFEDKNLISKMIKKLKHRGPDDSGKHLAGNLSLGQTRLSIIDLKGGHQPIHNENEDIFLIFNGEIYNYKTLREKLEKAGHRFYTETDTETIIHLFEEYGKECVNYLQGAFSFAIAHKDGLFLARDRLGIKPLYYSIIDKNLIFASEIKAIFEFEKIMPELNMNSLNEFLTFRYITGSKTMFENIFSLPPGHTLNFREGNSTLRKYWDLKETGCSYSEKECANRLRNLFDDAVKCRLMSDVPLGVYLSGGLDSSAVTSFMAKEEDLIKSFSVGFYELPNELDFARIAAEAFGTEHRELNVSLSDTIKHLSDILWHLDEPIGDPAVVPTFFISRFAKKYVTVVLTGEGADELFAGYLRYKLMLKGEKVRKFIPNIFLKMLSKILKIGKKRGNFFRILNFLSKANVEERYLEVISLFDDEEKNLLFKSDFNKRVGGKIIKKYFEDSAFRSLLNRILYHDAKTVLAEDFLVKIDKMTLSHGIEGRVPFLDHRIAEFAFSLPEKMRLSGKDGKYILKRALKGLVPKEIIERKKRGYDVPIDAWFKDELGEVYLSYLDEFEPNYFDKVYAQSLLKSLRKGGEDYNRNWYNSLKLWSLLSFFVWHKRFILKKLFRVELIWLH